MFQIIEKDINPHVDQWEKEGIYPAKEIFKKLSEAGLLGITRDTGKRFICVIRWKLIRIIIIKCSKNKQIFITIQLLSFYKSNNHHFDFLWI